MCLSASHLSYTCKAAVVLRLLLTFFCCYFRTAKQLWQQVCTPGNLFFKTLNAIMKKQKKKAFDSSVSEWRLWATKGGNVFQELSVPFSAHWKGQTMAPTLGKNLCHLLNTSAIWTRETLLSRVHFEKELNISESTFCLCARSSRECRSAPPTSVNTAPPFCFVFEPFFFKYFCTPRMRKSGRWFWSHPP